VHDRHYGEDQDGNRCIRVRHHVSRCSRYVGAFKSRATIELRSAITANANAVQAMVLLVLVDQI
jgi:hypothetical protein